MKRLLILLTAVFMNVGVHDAQDPQLSQFYAAPLYLSPSFSGSSNGSRVALNYRDQWPSLPGSFVTYMVSADHYFKEYNSGVGLMMMRDEAGGGKLNTTNIAAQYSYNLDLNRQYHFRPGIQFMYLQRSIDYSKLQFNDQLSFDGVNPTTVELPTDPQTAHFDFGVSLLFYSDKFWVGTTVDHLIKANPHLADNDNYLPLKYSFYGGYNIPLARSFYKRDEQKITIATHLKMQARDKQLDLGGYYHKDKLMFGLWYRGLPVFNMEPFHDAISVLFGYKFQDIRIGYSYDFTISRMITSTGGAHEVSLIYEFNKGNRRMHQRLKPIPCPSF